MQCFVASAVGKDDVDEIYDSCVCPILGKLSIQPMRVDRVEHNDDIDVKILELLDAADFALVDLTYARPSVYYEAGYAAGRGKPVIYMARSDHFRDLESDPHGLLHVHFDLKMKNIIPWFSANQVLSNKLEKRLRYVLRPLLREREVEEKLSSERSSFDSLPEDTKVELLLSKATALLRARSFSFRLPDLDTPQRWASGFRVSRQTRQGVVVVCSVSADKRLLERVAIRGASQADFTRQGPPLVEVHYLVVALRTVPRDRIAAALHEFASLNGGTFHLRTKSTFRPSVDIFVHVIGGVRSESELGEAVREVTRPHGLD